jgi:hypothetical protein
MFFMFNHTYKRDSKMVCFLDLVKATINTKSYITTKIHIINQRVDYTRYLRARTNTVSSSASGLACFILENIHHKDPHRNVLIIKKY